jgi:hypothetical protein
MGEKVLLGLFLIGFQAALKMGWKLGEDGIWETQGVDPRAVHTLRATTPSSNIVRCAHCERDRLYRDLLDPPVRSPNNPAAPTAAPPSTRLSPCHPRC